MTDGAGGANVRVSEPPPEPRAATRGADTEQGRDLSTASRYRWAVLAAGVVAQAAAAAVLQGLPSLSPLLRSELGLTLATLGLVLGSTTFGLLVALVAWGLLADRWGERWVMVAGLVLGAGALVAAARADGAVPLSCALFVAGAACASVNAASGRAVILWFPERQRGLAMGARQTAIPVGAALAAVTLPLLATRGGLDAAFAAVALACVLAAVVVAVVVREGPAPAATAEPRASRRREDRSAVRRVCLVSLLLVVPQLTVVGFLVVYLVDEHGVSAVAAAWALAGVQLAGGAARLVLGAYSDRRGTRLRPLRAVAAATAVLLGLAGLVRLGWGEGAVVVLVVGGVLAISWNGLAFVAVGELAPRHRIGLVLGVQNTAVAAGMTLTPPLVGVSVELAGWSVTFGWVAACALLAAVVLTSVVRAHRRPLAPDDLLGKAGESPV